MSTAGSCIVVGGGHAAAAFCNALTRSTWSGNLTVIADEPELPYHRPPLSKAQLNLEQAIEPQLIRPPAFYEKHGITVRSGSAVTAIEPSARTVRLDNEDLPYDHLVLATGSRHRLPPIIGIEQPGVYTLRTAQDARLIRQAARAGRRAIIIGAGFIGLEVAASLRSQGLAVTILELAPRVLSRVASPTVSTFFAALHRQRGVDLQTGVQVCELRKTADGIATLTSAGEAITGDFVVIGTGAAANDALARDAGLEVDNGIVVDAFNRSSDPNVYAIGDCCNQHVPRYDRRVRLESVQNANDQAKTAALAIAGTPTPHDALPWFWSDQFDVKYQIAGLADGHDQALVRGCPEPGSPFSVWHFCGDRLLAVDALNDPVAYAVGSKLLRADKSPAPELVADPDYDLKQLLKP